MNPLEARKMVENLSRGLDPYIARKLSIQDTCSDTDVQKALMIVLEHCTIESEDQKRERIKAEKIVERELAAHGRYQRYPNSGKAWTATNVADLISLHSKNYNIYQIANIMKRSPSAIKSQLKKLSLKPKYKNK